jgi:hypothetical protein
MSTNDLFQRNALRSAFDVIAPAPLDDGEFLQPVELLGQRLQHEIGGLAPCLFGQATEARFEFRGQVQREHLTHSRFDLS